MKRVILASLAACVCTISMAGCSQHSTSTSKEEIKTPGGTTTITTEKDVKKTGDHKDK